MVTDGVVTANVCVIPKRPVIIRLLERNGLSAISVLFSDPVSFVVFVLIAAVVVDVVVFIAAFIVVFVVAFIVVFVVAVATVFVVAVVVVGVIVEV